MVTESLGAIKLGQMPQKKPAIGPSVPPVFLESSMAIDPLAVRLQKEKTLAPSELQPFPNEAEEELFSSFKMTLATMHDDIIKRLSKDTK